MGINGNKTRSNWHEKLENLNKGNRILQEITELNLEI